MKENQFQELIRQAEGETLDFKQDGYDLADAKGQSDFTKDLLAMANTPREQDAHIVFGVRWKPESGSEVIGLERQPDDADLQDVVRKFRIEPTPRFIYTPLEFEGKQVGILTIPIDAKGPAKGPYIPSIDREGLQAGAVYYRRGTQNDRAVSELKRINNWFSEGDSIQEEYPENTWRQFFDAVHRFDPAKTYVLAVDRISPMTDAQIHALGMPYWRAVFDFDPKSDVSGILSHTKDTVERHAVIHRIVRNDPTQVHPIPGIHWFFAQGLSGRQETLVDSSHRAWLREYKQEIGRQLERVAKAVGHSPVVVLVLWSDVRLRKHLRTLIEELQAAFGDAIEVVLVSDDKPSFAEIAEEAGAAFVKINLRSLCSGLAVHYADIGKATQKDHILPASYGSSTSIKPEIWLWLSEDLELVHRDIGITGDDNSAEYRLGADISWRNLQLRHDCDRDITPELCRQVQADLAKRQTVRVNLYHEPGSGGTTVGRRLAWNLHNTFPVGILKNCISAETAEKIGKVSALTESSVLIIVDGGQHSERDIDDLYESLKANQTPTVLVQILRRFTRQTTGRRKFWLDTKLTDPEADRFRDAYTKSVPTKQMELAKLYQQRNDSMRNAFFFGLTAFGQNFRGLRPYVEDRIIGLTEEQRRILVYVSIAHYYGQQSIPAQAFVALLKLPRTKTCNLEGVFAGNAAPAIGLLVRHEQAEWRTTHYLVAREIMQQILAPSDSQDPENTWRQNLSSWGKDFADFCHGDTQIISDQFLELVHRVFIYRDNVDVLGTEQADQQQQLSQLINDIPAIHGRHEVLRHLIDVFPNEAHFHAHFGRFLSLHNEHEEALDRINLAIVLQPKDHVLHHMQGMAFRRLMRKNVEKEDSTDQLIEIAVKASGSFEEARRLRPDNEHAYVSEIQMLIWLLDQVRRMRKNTISNVLTQPGVNPFLRQSLQKAEELLDQVYHLYVGEKPSRYFIDCRARLESIYGNYSTALQAWDNLLSRPEITKPPVRRQIIWTILRKRDGAWDRLTDKDTARIRNLLEDNLEEEANNSTNLRLWIRAVRQLKSPPSLDLLIERVSYWKVNTGVLDAVYYLYVLHVMRALDGSSQSVADADKMIEECRRIAQFRRDRTKSFEWIGHGTSINALVHQSRLGDWKEDFWEAAGELMRLRGRIKNIRGPQGGQIVFSDGVEAFFVPGKSGFHRGRDENASVSFYLGFSYDGPRAWDVQPIET